MFTPAEEVILRRVAKLFANRKPIITVVPPLLMQDANGGGSSISIPPSYLKSEGDDAGNDGTDAAGFTTFCQETASDGYGGTFVTAIKRRETWDDRSFRCKVIDTCCAEAWWCVSNEWIESAQSCCAAPPGVSIARYVLLSFSVVSGTLTLDDLGLPDGIYLVNESGSLVWSGTSSNGSAWTLGKNLVTGGLTWACDGSDLEATVNISGFTGGSPVISSCTLTASPLALGNWTYERTISTTCKESGAVYSTTETATISLTVASWLDGSDPATGVQSIASGIAPPYDASGLWKTEAEAVACCGLFINQDDLGLDGTTDCQRVCNFNVRRYVKGVMRLASTGVVIAETASFDLLTAMTGAPGTLPICTTSLALSSAAPIPGCVITTPDLVVGIGCGRRIVGADTFSTPSVGVGWSGTIFTVQSSVVPSAGWSTTAPTTGRTFEIAICGTDGFLRAPTLAGTLTVGDGGGSGCASVAIELWIEPA